MSWVATTGGINGQMIRDLIAESAEARFGASGLPHSLQWLTDNGSIYTSNKTRKFAADAGFDVCATPAYSPESNGMAESFVKTFKRDYVQVHNLETPEEVMMQLGKWFEDFNFNHPHKGLKMLSPREFKAQQPIV